MHLSVKAAGKPCALRLASHVSRKMLMLLMQRDKDHVAVADDVAAPLLNRHVIVPPIEGVQVRLLRSPSSKHISGSRMRSPFCCP